MQKLAKTQGKENPIDFEFLILVLSYDLISILPLDHVR